MNKTTKVFYEEIIKEAASGRVEADRYLNVKFNTQLLGDELIYNDDFSPMLIIKNQQVFDEYLKKYVDSAYAFYDKNFYEDITKAEKTLMTTVWNNANASDFANPLEFLKRSTDFINDHTLEEYKDGIDLGYSAILNSNIEAKINKNRVLCETPYSLNVTLSDHNDPSLRYELPLVTYGVSENKAYIYSIKGKNKYERERERANNSDEVNAYQDKIEQTMRIAVKQNFKEPASSRDDITHPEHMSGIMPWHLLAANITLGVLKKHNIDEVLVSDYQLLIRWNGKELANKLKAENADYDFDALHERHEADARNTTDKLLRTFRRLDYHYDSLNVSAYPQEIDNFMHIDIDEPVICNNELLEETYLLSLGKTKNK